MPGLRMSGPGPPPGGPSGRRSARGSAGGAGASDLAGGSGRAPGASGGAAGPVRQGVQVDHQNRAAGCATDAGRGAQLPGAGALPGAVAAPTGGSPCVPAPHHRGCQMHRPRRPAARLSLWIATAGPPGLPLSPFPRGPARPGGILHAPSPPRRSRPRVPSPRRPAPACSEGCLP